jgi:hypothetical protein
MPRTVKTVKDKEGNDIEVYSDNCIVCSTEMVFPKNEADNLEQLFPFLKEKIDAGTHCVDCMKKKIESDNNYNVFSQEEMEDIKRKVLETASK